MLRHLLESYDINPTRRHMVKNKASVGIGGRAVWQINQPHVLIREAAHGQLQIFIGARSE